MILENNKGKLRSVPEKDFKLEKEIQSLVEANLGTLLGLEFLATEFPIESFRFDSVAFDRENNAFVIIEYKKGRNESLVDQGLAYLNTLLTRKADFVLLYNEVKGESRLAKDFDWSQTKLVFVSPKFTPYQLKSVAFKDFGNFHLYEIKQYANGLIQFVEREVERDITANLDNPGSRSELATIKKEIVVHTEAEHLEKGGQGVAELYELLKQKVLDLGEVKVEPKQLYIAFKAATNICDITIQKNEILIMINLYDGELEDNNHYCRLMKNAEGKRIGHWGNGDYQCRLRDPDELDYLMTLIRQSYRKNS